MKETPKATPEPKVTQQAVSRRELLKIMSATGGVLAASAFIPNTWLSPMVEIGVLPAHAQATAEITISNLQYTLHPPGVPNASKDSGVVAIGDTFGGEHYGTVSFFDPTGLLAQAICQIIMQFQTGSLLSYIILSLVYQTATTGTITWRFITDCAPGLDACTQIKNTDTNQESNTECDQLPGH